MFRNATLLHIICLTNPHSAMDPHNPEKKLKIDVPSPLQMQPFLMSLSPEQIQLVSFYMIYGFFSNLLWIFEQLIV